MLGGNLMRHNNTFYHPSFPDTFKYKGFHVPIYRIIPFHRILDILKNKNLHISQTLQWEDSYENFLAKADVRMGNLPITFRDFLPCFYGQCWSLLKETDAMWRIYSPEKTGVQIRTTIYKLLEASLNEELSNEFDTKIRVVGQVKYLSNNQINKWVLGQDVTSMTETSLLESLFIKRKEFSHEKEVRLIINKRIDRDNELRDIQRKFIQFPIDPNDFLDEVTFDPRLSNSDFDIYFHVLKALGYNNTVRKSQLYNFSPHKIEW